MDVATVPSVSHHKQCKRIYFTPRRVARLSVFIALSAIGAIIKVPSPTGTVALDSCMGYFSAATFGLTEGAIVAAIGHILTSLTTGFPLGIPIHLFIAVQMALWVITFRFLTVKVHPLVGFLGGTFFNGVVSAFMMIPFGGIGLAIALMFPLIIGSAANISIALIAYSIVKKSSLV
jgi:uncharacterized membrane protein